MHIIGISNNKLSGIHMAGIDQAPIFIPVKDYTRWFCLLEQLQQRVRGGTDQWKHLLLSWHEKPADSPRDCLSLQYSILCLFCICIIHIEYDCALARLSYRPDSGSNVHSFWGWVWGGGGGDTMLHLLQQFALEITLRIQREPKLEKRWVQCF